MIPQENEELKVGRPTTRVAAAAVSMDSSMDVCATPPAPNNLGYRYAA